MAGFVFVRYSGDDAGDVLLTMLSGPQEQEPEVVEVETQTRIGFQPNPVDDDEEQEDEDDGEETDQHRLVSG